MQPPPEVERFNEDIVYENQNSKKNAKQVTKQDLELMSSYVSKMNEHRTNSNVTKSRKSMSEVKWKAAQMEKQKKSVYQSTVKTGDILKLINGVNFLSEKQELLSKQRAGNNQSQLVNYETTEPVLTR